MGTTLAESIWRQGFTKIQLKNGSYLSLPISELNTVVADWKAGKAFGEYQGIYNHTCFVKFAEVVVIIEATRESIILEEQDEDFDTARQKAKELTNG